MEATLESVQRIDLVRSESNHYLLKEKVESSDGITAIGTAKITGYHFGKLNEGDILNLYNVDYVIVDVMQRNHAGKFRDESKRINSFFEANCTFVKQIKK